MKPKLLDRSTTLGHSFGLHHHLYSHFLKVWHYHQELELVLVKKSTGTRFLGDSIKKFHEGDLVLIGENLPHMWQNDVGYFENENEGAAEAIAIHFKYDFAGDQLFNLAEMARVKHMLETARQGILFKGGTRVIAEGIMERMLVTSGLDRFLLFLKLLGELAHETEIELLASPGFIDSFRREDNRRLDAIYAHTHNNFKEEIRLEEVADMAGMNISSFCRYFKKATNKTFSHYLNEVRIGFACRLLIESSYNISEICYESGFNNISNFNRQFKSIVNMSPSGYVRVHRNHNQEDLVKETSLVK